MESVENFLNACGFTATRSIALTDNPCFTGRIRVGEWQLQLELRFCEGRFDFPYAYLPEWPYDEELRSAFGSRHINSKGKVCYVDESRSWWDSSMAVELVSGVLERIKALLAENLAGAPAGEIIARDFDGYWNGVRTLYIAKVAQNGEIFHQFWELNSQREWLVTDRNSAWFEIDDDKSLYTRWVVLHLSKPASSIPCDTWPPKSLSHILGWIHSNSPSGVARLVTLIRRSVLSKGKKKQKDYATKVGVLLTWPGREGNDTLGCGFSFTIPEIPAQAIAHGRLKQAARLLRNDHSEIVRYRINRSDPSYIQTRNTSNKGPSLKNRVVLLVGAGTIGSHLAKLLCSHGAGWGPRGKLNIIDFDRVGVENIGRHLLGAESVGELKAHAVAMHLKKAFPYMSINAYPKPVTKCWHLFTDESVVIDATGSQTVSIAIPDYLSQKRLTPVLLHSWIHGHGSATVAFLNDRKIRGAACFRCLWKINKNTYQPRYPLSRNANEDTPIFAGCHHSYHAYASTISMIAAAQAMTLLYDYLTGQVEKTLRFNVLRTDLCQNRPDATPRLASDCPICNR